MSQETTHDRQTRRHRAVLVVAQLYYDGMHGADEAKLRKAFDPRVCIIGNFQGGVSWMNLDDFVEECRSVHDRVGAYGCRLESLDMVGDTAVARWFSDYLVQRLSEHAENRQRWSIVNKTFYAHPSS